MKFNIKAVIFDFDGVIAESVSAKTEAFAQLYKPYGKKVVNKVVNHHLAHSGISRYEKFKRYHRDFLGINISNHQLEELSKQFSALVIQKVIDAPYVPGALEFIETNYKKFIFFISSGTPELELRKIVSDRNIANYFKGIFGAPDSKSAHVKKILKTHNLNEKELVFIGDAPSDRDAAKQNQIYFIGRYTTSKEILKERIVVQDLLKLSFVIETLDQKT